MQTNWTPLTNGFDSTLNVAHVGLKQTRVDRALPPRVDAFIHGSCGGSDDGSCGGSDDAIQIPFAQRTFAITFLQPKYSTCKHSFHVRNLSTQVNRKQQNKQANERTKQTHKMTGVSLTLTSYNLNLHIPPSFRVSQSFFQQCASSGD